MPLSRYQIRNEYSLADPELYKAADKDDPEALLEGVAMAGLVGVLRQLGDLAEFAAVVFHDLHEEVMATAARGHSLMVRVQQLEVEFPSIEKAFLSQTNHSSFFYNAGIDWHPNMSMEQNVVTRGDLPRFIMDSYEECRGPPRLFLLDKFDVAGAGACLKRYTDPSFFKLGSIDADVQREKRARKGKKKGPRLKNGETPDIIPTPHAKLHQLLLEERIENAATDPARRVKLKRRLNGFPFDSKIGKSYMEKVLKTPSPEHKEVLEVSVRLSPLKLPSNSAHESALNEHDLSSEFSDIDSRLRSPSPTPDVEDVLQKINKMNDVASDSEICELSKANNSLETDSINHEEVGDKDMAIDKESKIEKEIAVDGESKIEKEIAVDGESKIEKEIAVDGEIKTKGSIDSYQSDDVASEVENYVDALATMEPEMDTDSELRARGDLHDISRKRRLSGFDDAKALHQAQFSDSQSMGSSIISDDGNSSSKKDVSSSSYSDTPSISGVEVPNEAFLSNEIFEVKRSRPLKWRGRAKDAGRVEVTDTPTTYSSGQIVSYGTVPPVSLAHMDIDATMSKHTPVEAKVGEMLCARDVPKTELSIAPYSAPDVNVTVPCNSNTCEALLQKEDDSALRVSAESPTLDDLDDKHLNMDARLPRDPYISDDPYYTRVPKNQHMDELVDGNLILQQNVTPGSDLLDGPPLNTEENVSLSSPTYQSLDEASHDDSSMVEHQPELPPEDLPVNRQDLQIPNLVSCGGSEDLNVLSGASVHPSISADAIPEEEMNKTLLDILPEIEDAEDNCGIYSVGNQIHSPVSIMPHAEGQTRVLGLPELDTLETAKESVSVADEEDDAVSPSEKVADVILRLNSHEDLHSKDLHIAEETENIQLLDPAVNSNHNQIESPIPDVYHAEEQSLDHAWAEFENSVSGAEAHDIIFDENNTTPPARETAVDMKHLTGSPNGCDSKEIHASLAIDDVPINEKEDGSGHRNLHELASLGGGDKMDDPPTRETAEDTKPLTGSPLDCGLKEMQASVIAADDVPQLHMAEVGTSYNGEKNLHELSSVTNEEIMDGVTPIMQLVGEDASGLMVSDASASEPFVGSLHVNDSDIVRDHAESNPNGIDAEVSLSGSYSELNVVKEESVEKFDSLILDSGLIETLHDDHVESEVLNNVPDSYPETKSSVDPCNSATASSALEQSELGTNRLPSEESTSIDYTKDTSSLPIDSDAVERKVEFFLNHPDMEKTEVLRKKKEANFDLSIPSVQKRNLEHVDQEECSFTASIPLLRNFSGHPTASELLPQDYTTIDEIVRPKDSLGSIPPLFSLLPEANINLEEVPPLPPLPPVQWRMGKNHHASSSPEEAIQNNTGVFPSLSSYMFNHKAQPLNPFLPPYAVADENLPLVYNTLAIPERDSEFSFQVPPVSHLESNTNVHSLGEMQSVKETSQLHGKFDGTCQNDDHAGDRKLTDPSFSTFSEETWVDTSSAHAAGLSHEEAAFRPQREIAPETSSRDRKLDDGSPCSDENLITHDANAVPSKIEIEPPQKLMLSSEGEIAWPAQDEGKPNGGQAVKLPKREIAPETSSKDGKLDDGSLCSDKNLINHDVSAVLPKIENEPPQKMMLSSEGEIAWLAQDEGKANGGRTVKLPRPRNPLIDAVVAHDKSKLRKVTERPRRPQIEKADERDSLLEQIRAKSFNLKPTVVTRPSIQGPATNLKVAAILEKAKTIRQAFAGSDEDDDTDSWSDS